MVNLKNKSLQILTEQENLAKDQNILKSLIIEMINAHPKSMFGTW